MPIFLPPIDRRAFLRDCFAGTVALSTALSASIPAAAFAWAEIGSDESSLPDDVLAFLSDTHIPADRTRTGGKPQANPIPVNPVDHLAKVRDDILSGASGKPGRVVVCGDCVHLKGLPEDYVTLLEEFRPFREAGLPVHFVMGNHDHRKAFLDAVADETTAVEERTDSIDRERRPEPPDRICSVLETPKANFFLLDSLEITNQTSGLFGEAQLDWLADQLDARPEKPALLVAHHYPDYTRGIINNPHALKDTEAFFERIRDRKQVKAYLFGHAHIWKQLRKDGIHLVNLPTTAWRFDLSQPYAWVLMKLREDGMSLTLRSLDPEHPKHDETVDFVWRDS